MMTTLEIQRRLKKLGFDPGRLDGKDGPQTRKATVAALDAMAEKHAPSQPAAIAKPDAEAVVPTAWMPAARMERIICHWTAGSHKASKLDRDHYHLLVEGDGKLVRGTPSIALNQAPARKGYAAHTLNCNSGSIGVSMCCMAGAMERPFKAGSSPMTEAQWNRMVEVVGALCRRYAIPVTPETVLSHAEVANNLGIKQRGKIDIIALPFDPKFPRGAKVVGDRLRADVKAVLG